MRITSMKVSSEIGDYFKVKSVDAEVTVYNSGSSVVHVGAFFYDGQFYFRKLPKHSLTQSIFELYKIGVHKNNFKYYKGIDEIPKNHKYYLYYLKCYELIISFLDDGKRHKTSKKENNKTQNNQDN